MSASNWSTELLFGSNDARHFDESFGILKGLRIRGSVHDFDPDYDDPYNHESRMEQIRYFLEHFFALNGEVQVTLADLIHMKNWIAERRGLSQDVSYKHLEGDNPNHYIPLLIAEWDGIERKDFDSGKYGTAGLAMQAYARDHGYEWRGQVEPCVRKQVFRQEILSNFWG